MNKNFVRKSLCGLAMVAALVLASCGSENETPVEYTDLPAAVSADFNSRCPGNTIERVYTGKESYRHTDLPETDVYSVDSAGNEWFVVYFQDTPLAKNCTHTLVVDSEGRTLKECTYMLNNTAFVRPFTVDISWISEHYDGATVLCYVNDFGYDGYIVLHDGILKSVYFDSYSGDEAEWKETRYGLPEGMSVPNHVLDTLHSLDAEFTYTEVEVVETPNGNYYSLVDGTKPERPGYNIGASR